MGTLMIGSGDRRIVDSVMSFRTKTNGKTYSVFAQKHNPPEATVKARASYHRTDLFSTVKVGQAETLVIDDVPTEVVAILTIPYQRNP